VLIQSECAHVARSLLNGVRSVSFKSSRVRGCETNPKGLTVPLIGDIQASGLTRQQLTRQLTQALSAKLVSPDVTIQIAQVNSKKYYITGEVNRVGFFPMTTPLTVFDALNSAGGFKEFANKGKIVIARGKDRIKFNYLEVLKGKHLEQNILLQAGDTIIVP